MKQCTICSEVKQLSDFNKNKTKPDGHGNQCRPCINQYDKDRRSTNREYVHKHKTNLGCKICRYNKHPEALDLAHRDRSEKDRGSGNPRRSAYKDSWTLERIKREIAKCDVLCANCHRIETAKERNNSNKGNLS